MAEISIAVQIVIALGIFNVWFLRSQRATAWRGGEAKTMREEFLAYNLPGWSMIVIGLLKVSLAVLLIVGVWLPTVVVPAAAAMALLMLGAIVMHVRVKDPFKKSLPALLMLVLSLVVVAGHLGLSAT